MLFRDGVAMFEKVLNELSCGHKYGLSAPYTAQTGLYGRRSRCWGEWSIPSRKRL